MKTEYRTLLLEDWSPGERKRPQPTEPSPRRPIRIAPLGSEADRRAPRRAAFLNRFSRMHGLPRGGGRPPDFCEQPSIKTEKKNLTMKLNLRFHGLKPRPLWRDQVEKELQGLQQVAAISLADVVLEQRRESGRFFRIRALLAVPGPDFHAEGRDHTFPAALRKLMRDLGRQIQQRKSRRLHRRRERLGNSPLGFGLLASGRR